MPATWRNFSMFVPWRPQTHPLSLTRMWNLSHVDIERNGAETNEEAVELAQTFIRKMRFTYDPECFDNPALQTHFKNLEAMALGLPEPEPIIDFTG